MNPFEKLAEGIPLHEAAQFFIGLKKFAGKRIELVEMEASAGQEKTASADKYAEWVDPPDETGELEGMFAAPVEQVLAKLTDVITAKFRKAMAYELYAESVKGLSHESIEQNFRQHIWDEQEGARYYTQRAAVLGGPVHVGSIEPPPASNNPIGMLKTMIRAEQEGIQAQRELRDLVGDDNPMKVGIEDHLKKDQHHLDELWKTLPEEERGTAPVIGVGAPQDAEALGGEPEVAPEEMAEGGEAPPEGVEEVEGAEEGASEEDVAEKVAGAFFDYKKSKGKEPRLKAGITWGKKGKKSKEKNAAACFQAALQKLGFGDQTQSVEGAEMSTPSPGGPGPGPETQPPAVGPEVGGEQVPTNYLGAELLGQQHQEQNESNFYRNKLQQMQGSFAAIQQQAADAQQQMEQVQQQANEAGAQVQAATDNAQQAMDQAFQKSQEAANMRMGVQQMQMQLMDIAGQDPSMLGGAPPGAPGMGESAAQAAQPMMGAEVPGAELGGEPAPEGGPAGGAPAAGGGVPPGTPPAGAGAAAAGGETSSVPEQAPSGESGSTTGGSSKSTPSVNLKVGSVSAEMMAKVAAGFGRELMKRAPFAMGGAALGAYGVHQMSKKGPGPAQAKLEQLEGQPGSFRQAMEIAKAKSQAAMGELVQKHPGPMMGMGAASGALAGAQIGPALAGEVKRLGSNLKQL